MKPVRITVIKTSLDEALIAKHTTQDRSVTQCSHQVGESFLVDQPVMCPEGLCPWAWHDIESFVRIVAFEGVLEGSNPPNSWVRCCTDALRPVTFLIEPLNKAEGKIETLKEE